MKRTNLEVQKLQIELRNICTIHIYSVVYVLLYL